ncbi:UDP-glucose 4-epimerase [Pandoraea pnomenusa]|jgi:UDP-glucose 4-epimerase|uniref:UDP-glucose 4-epimerase n=1 Tax=Pandoraea pnomenusa TaxID=93220 RepID=A0A378YNP3_9BURK|nr:MULTISPECIES: UDP-glucose 4-epimerase GalE [Pandoraea]AHB04150.1 UDP-galactose-4-epimerase [Pandoraea pnomenusa 3kgm]AHN76219.1 UDP-glucose 4-epimerase [Pandoraea pnomenusa]AIU27146.1 UDP-glucose 4-epimerase [Pandoraea pnomenusa]ANC44360.1 UDP-glucose 4-epimerase [Pandoraea pnomenusa]MBN9094526.1 UDP-glucose 4-epimerase GalE [Pandoraea pnomenusa]
MNNSGTILVTGGAGYIGSHTCVELLSHGYDVVIVDNLVNSHRESVVRVGELAGRAPVFIEGDACSKPLLADLFARFRFTGAIHFAALKAVGESVEKPVEYYRNNLDSLLALVETMRDFNVKDLVFSSSATVYGNPASVPIDESFPLSATNPYGQTKLMAETILNDVAAADPAWRIALLRYFNPVGAHESGRIGEDPVGVPSNLMPFVAQVAIGKRPAVNVFGGNWNTPDGTGIRDYIHVVDLARGHLAALASLQRLNRGFTVNLGTGRGYSVLEVIKAFEAASGRPVPFKVTERRPGDIESCYAATDLARTLLGWEAEYGIDRMCADHWRWQMQNPDGYR